MREKVLGGCQNALLKFWCLDLTRRGKGCSIYFCAWMEGLRKLSERRMTLGVGEASWMQAQECSQAHSVDKST